MKPTHDKLASVLKTGVFNKPYRSFKDLEKKISELGKINTLAIEIDATWSAQNYIEGLVAYYLDPKTPSSRG